MAPVETPRADRGPRLVRRQRYYGPPGTRTPGMAAERPDRVSRSRRFAGPSSACVADRRRADPGPRERWAREEIRKRVSELLPLVGLPAGIIDQYPHEFSGGGRQRLSLARALSVHPKVLILDEPTSALDVAVQAQILNRLVSLQRELALSCMLITHNVAAVRYVADRVAVMNLGLLAEVGPVREVLEHPIHPYTKALLAALPLPDPRRRRARYRIRGEVPTLIHPPVGCRFAARCPFVIDRCRIEDPLLRELPQHPGRSVACHRAEEIGDVPPEELIAGLETPANA